MCREGVVKNSVGGLLEDGESKRDDLTVFLLFIAEVILR